VPIGVDVMNKVVLSLMGMIATPIAMACSTCMVGDPTQSLMGAEKPFENRLRFSADLMTRSEELGEEGFNKKEIDEIRGSLNFAYAPSTRLMLGINIPYVNRQLTSFNLSEQEITALGDITLTVKNFMQEKEFLQNHMYGLLGGVKLPTAKEHNGDDGLPLDFDVQVGQGATVVNAGAWYSHFNYPYLFYTSASYHVASEGYQDFQAGDALVFNATAQYAKSHTLSFGFGMEGRWSQKDTFANVDDPDSGGTIIFLAPGVVYTIKEDLLINAVVKFPTIDSLNGNHEEGAIFTIGVTYDFEIH